MPVLRRFLPVVQRLERLSQRVFAGLDGSGQCDSGRIVERWTSLGPFDEAVLGGGTPTAAFTGSEVDGGADDVHDVTEGGSRG